METRKMWALRPYQKRFCRAVTDAFDGRVNNTAFTKVLATAATGAGKTIIASALIWYWTRTPGNRCLFLADTDELCDQSVKKLYASASIIADLEKAASRASRQSDVVVASIQSMQGRLARWPGNHFSHVIADEAHMSMADGWQKTLKHFHEGGARILGVTATPERGDKQSLMKFYEHLAADIPLAELIRERHLSAITVETVPLEIRINSTITAGAENEDVAEELAAYWHAIIDAVEKHAPDRKRFLWFHPSVAASKRFSSLLMERGHTSAHVDGSSPDRAEIVEGFTRGRFRHLNNCQMLTKGFDCPDIDCVVILRPVKSRTAYIQMAGRGTRLYCPHGCTEWCDHPDRKRDMLLLDFLWEFATHDVMGPADLLTDAPVQKKELAERLKKGKMDLLLTDEMIISDRESDLLAKLKAQRGKRGNRVDALTFAALLHQPDLLDYEPVANWQRRPVSEEQRRTLEVVGVDVDSLQDRGHASAVITHVLSRRDGDLATVKQIRMLLEYGVKDPHLLTCSAASAQISQLLSVKR